VTAKDRVLEHPRHAIIGSVIFLSGLNFMLNDTYFFWPPYAVHVLNDDVLGFSAMIIGFWLIHWALQKRRSTEVNRNLLMAASAFFVFDATAELVHGVVGHGPHMYTAAIADFGLFLIVLVMARTGKKS
jgi:hypothetical protein